MRTHMTEDQAKKKWCPMQKDRLKDEDGMMLPRYACIASECMWWEFSDQFMTMRDGKCIPCGRCKVPGGVA